MDWARQFVSDYGYLAVFIWTFIEGETVFLAAAALAAAGVLTPPGVILSAAAGAFSGHLCFFAVGRRYGLRIIERFPALHRRRGQFERIFHDYAHWSIFVFQYLYGTRIAAAILFGTTAIPFARFCWLQLVNCLSWSLVVYTIGHLLGMAGMVVLERFGKIGLIVAVIVALCLVATSALGLKRAHRRRQGHPDRHDVASPGLKPPRDRDDNL